MVQASSFLLLLAFSAVLIQGAPLAARSKEHHTKDKPPTEESKLQLQDTKSGSALMSYAGASSFGPNLPFVQEGTPLGTGGAGSPPTGSSSTGSPAGLPYLAGPQNCQADIIVPAAEAGLPSGYNGILGGDPPMASPPCQFAPEQLPPQDAPAQEPLPPFVF
ncbi:hypothetical protein BCR42DRAFT_443330 [Absidia repens]|uniref:Uncharacterized protein n=1 Tax=Absidia repens TaxID=90262 RepID=A0A1X2HZY0_9FUNG|nr:hypothetical protein BCR42DRAFT_443330 [Absidia repens]